MFFFHDLSSDLSNTAAYPCSLFVMTSFEPGFLVTGYIRVAALSLFAYEYVSTLPLVCRIYKDHWPNGKVTMSNISVILLFLLRLMSMLAILFGFFGFFYQDFTKKSCAGFYVLAPTFRVAQTTVSQAILAYRAIILSERSTYVIYILIAASLMACPLQWVSALFGREPALGTYWSNCRAAVVSPFLGVWLGYAIAIVYDLLTTAICLWFLLRLKLENPFLSKLFTIMIRHGLAYFLVLTGANIVNAVIFSRNSEYEAAGAPLGCCVTMIMSQKLLTDVYTWRYLNRCGVETVNFSRDVLDSSQFGRTLRTQTGTQHLP